MTRISNACDILRSLIGGRYGAMLMPGEEYEANAAECRRLAAQTKNPKLKKQLDDMAEGWDRLARQRRHVIIENNFEQT
jgi:hypothetical protein